jgi:crotonobetainyl-CoA:carnitine CoA-transferase CaiB-like acyl-CoA transferase
VTGILHGVRVVDASEGPVAGLATMVLADFGADVVKVERPGGDPYRAQASAPLWLRGKKSVVADPQAAAGRATLRELALAADVFVTHWLPEDAAQHGVAHEALLAEHPGLVYCRVTAFGSSGPYARYAPYEAVVAAKVGRMLNFRGIPDRDGPVYAALQVATHAASQSAASGILAALEARDRDGAGQLVETSLLRGLLPYDMGGALGRQLGRRGRRAAAAVPAAESSAAGESARPMPSFNYHPVRCADGRWLQLGNLLPHLFVDFLKVSDLHQAVAQSGRPGLPQSWPEEAREAFRDHMLQHMQQRTAQDWQALFVADGGVASHPYQTTQQALDDPDVLANGHAVDVAGGRQLGLLGRFERTPGRVGTPAPAVGADDGRIAWTRGGRGTGHTGTGPAARPAGGTRRPPLDGFTVVEASTIIATPFAASMLADLGARVIKLEPLGGDPFRTMGGGVGAARVNTGKECIAVDLKRAEGQAIAQRLIDRADLVMHNYRPGVPERLGIDYATLSARNPRLVYLACNGYGPSGPGALRPSTHPIPGAALGGVLYQVGGPPDTGPMSLALVRETARRLMRANEVNPDPNTSVVACTLALLGLRARRVAGTGQEVFADMFGANAYANFDDFLRWPGKPERRLPDRDGYGIDPLWRLYRCREGWVFLGIANDVEWARLKHELGDASLPDAAASARADATTAARLQALFAARDAAAWEAALAPHGVGCVRADERPPTEFLFDDPQAQAEDLLVDALHPEWGAYRRHGAMVRFEATPAVLRGTSLTGQHTDALLEELGVGADERARLRAARVVA